MTLCNLVPNLTGEERACEQSWTRLFVIEICWDWGEREFVLAVFPSKSNGFSVVYKIYHNPVISICGYVLAFLATLGGIWNLWLLTMTCYTPELNLQHLISLDGKQCYFLLGTFRSMKTTCPDTYRGLNLNCKVYLAVYCHPFFVLGWFLSKFSRLVSTEYSKCWTGNLCVSLECMYQSGRWGYFSASCFMRYVDRMRYCCQ